MVPRTTSTSLTPTAPDIHAERVKAVFQQTPVVVLVNVVNAALMTALLAGAVGDRRVFAWLAAVIVLGVVRLAVWRAHRRALRASGKAPRWAAVASTCGSLASGLLWGGGAVALLPASETYQLFWVFLIGGMCAGAAVLHSAHLPTAVAYIVPAGLPLAVRLAATGSQEHGVAAAMIAIFVVALVVASGRYSRHFGEVFRLQLDLARRTSDLDSLGRKLRMEVAEHRATETALRHAQRMEAVGQLTGGIAHDFNNLLTAVLGSLELLRKRLPPDDERAMRLLDNAVQGAGRGAALTQRLLAFGRRQALKPEAVDLPALVRGMSGLLRSSLGGGIRVETRFPMILASAYVDANQLELALLNLAVNARDAMSGGGDLTIAAREKQVRPGERAEVPPGSYVVLSVADTGAGMDEATLTKAVEPFFTTKGVGKGTGLGLSMVHGLAAQSGGQLVLRSRKGEGTTAELWLRRAETVSEAPVPPSEPAPPPRGRRGTVLIVDDDPLVLASTAALLEDLGHSAVEAASGREALEIIRTGVRIDLVITDYVMPGMSGAQLAEELRRLQPMVPVLLATGYAEPQESLAPGLPRLAKPFEQEALAQAVAGCIDAEAGNKPALRQYVS